MVLKKLLGLTDLLEAQTLCIHEMMEVVVICDDKNLILVAFQVMGHVLKAFTIAKSSPSWVLYYISVKIIFFKKNAIRCHWPKSVFFGGQ